MNDWKDATVGPDATLRDVMRRIDASAIQITMVVDADGVLLGTVTDGDVRRGILGGVGLEDPVTLVMNRNPTTAGPEDDHSRLVILMRNLHFRQIPVVDANRRLVGLRTLNDVSTAPEIESSVVLMAGGLGTRLMPLTASTPKPMLLIAGKPILEHTLEGLAEQGFRRFYFSVNYLSEVIEDYFGDGSPWGVSIEYVRELERMGTAGALSLLPKRPTESLLVMNGDIITKLNFGQLIETHKHSGALATVCVRDYDYQVPFGVVRINDNRLVGIDEKPTFRHFVSAGIYIIDPSVLDYVAADCPFDMPQLLQLLIKDGREVNVFPIAEYWLDIGRHEELNRAMVDFETSSQ